MLYRHAQRSIAFEGRTSGQRVIAGDTERVDVAAGIDGSAFGRSGLMYNGVPIVMPI